MTRGIEPAATPEPYIPTWDVVYADDFDATNLQRRWDVDISPFIALDGDNRFLHLTQPDTLLSLGGYSSGVRLKARVRLLDGSFAVGLRKGNVGRYQTEFFAVGRVVLTRNDTTIMAVGTITPTGTWRDLSVTALEGEILVLVDGVEIISIRDPLPLPHGVAYVSTGSTPTDAAVDDVQMDEIVDLNAQQVDDAPRTEPDLDCDDMTGYQWCALIDFRINFYGFGQGPRTAGVGYHGPATYAQVGYSRWYRGSGNRSWTNASWQVRKIQVLYDYQPGQTYGAACSANHIYVVDRYGAGAQTVASFAPSAGTNQVATWTGTKSMYDGMRFHYQHACANRIPWLTPNPAGAMTVKKIVLVGGNSPLGSNFPPTSTPTVTPTPTETSTPTPTETETCGVRNLCAPTPTSTPTVSFTGLNFYGSDSGLQGVMFWIIYYEIIADSADSGTNVDSDLPSVPSRHTEFLSSTPYCDFGENPPSDNSAEPILELDPLSPADTEWWYIKHCPFDHRFMFARTMMNAFLNYERRGYSPFDYALTNNSSAMNPNNTLWSIFPVRTIQPVQPSQLH